MDLQSLHDSVTHPNFDVFAPWPGHSREEITQFARKGARVLALLEESMNVWVAFCRP